VTCPVPRRCWPEAEWPFPDDEKRKRIFDGREIRKPGAHGAAQALNCGRAGYASRSDALRRDGRRADAGVPSRDKWQHIYRVVLLPRFDAEYEICNWFTGADPQSPYRNNLIAALLGPNGTRLTLFNARFNVRRASGYVERRTLQNEAEYRTVLREQFGVMLSDADLKAALANVEQRGERGPPHPFFA
jgi:hypothetical protein